MVSISYHLKNFDSAEQALVLSQMIIEGKFYFATKGEGLFYVEGNKIHSIKFGAMD
jgi:hypothetical protein